VVLDGGSTVDGFYLAQTLRRHLGIGPAGDQASATAGIADAAHSCSKDELIRRADLALIEAKRSHRSALVFTADLDAPASARQRLDHRHATTLATALARAVDAKDAYTHSHCETVAELCALMAEHLGLPQTRVAQVRVAGLLHDVGKIGIADRILQKPGPLSPEEVRVMQTHPTLGCHIVSAAELYEEAGWILHHHERLDGGGYPDRLDGPAIPLESRIIMVADAFEAITADRPYRDRRSVPEALGELRRHAGTQFDVRCLEALEQLVAIGVAPHGPVLDQAHMRTAA
jgi:putative nucleotidyltransferase with HDIG domain